ncbi:MAG: hypothetical protein WBZ42_06915 [Halobacteriota archaeon]
MTGREEFILSELKRLQREIDVLKKVYAHYLEEGLKREERAMEEMNKMRARMEEAAQANEKLLKRNEDLLKEIKENQERIFHV